MPVDFNMEKTAPEPGADSPPVPAGLFGNGLDELSAIMGGDEPSPEAEQSEEGHEPAESAAAQPVAEKSPQSTSDDDLRRQYAELNERYATLERRLADTQQWGNHERMIHTATQALIQAQQQKERVAEEMRRREVEAKFPEIDFGDGEELLADPKKLVGAIHRANQQTGEWSYRRAIAEVMPYVSQVMAGLNLMEIARPFVEEMVRERAKRSLVATGELDEGQADKVLDRAYREMIDQDQNAAAWRLRPDAVALAANYIRQQGGAPIKTKPNPAPSAGGGDAATRATTRRKPALSPTQVKLRPYMEKMMGVTFTEQDLAKLPTARR